MSILAYQQQCRLAGRKIDTDIFPSQVITKHYQIRNRTFGCLYIQGCVW